MSRRALAAALLIPLVGVGELALELRDSTRAPTTLDWAAARPRVAALRAEAEGVIVAPWWSEPHARRAFGDSLLPLRDVARPDASRYGSLVEVSALGERLDETANWHVRREERLAHGLVARVLDNPSPAKVVTDFVDRVEAVRGVSVAHVIGSREEACPFSDRETIVSPGLFGHPTLPQRRFACGRLPWLSVGVTVHDDERFRARRCVWSHPPQGGEVRITFADVPLGRVVRGHLSIHWTLEREERGTPVTFDVDVDGARVGSVRHEDGEGFRPFEIPLGEHAGTSAREVTFHIASPSSNERHVCWEADSR